MSQTQLEKTIPAAKRQPNNAKKAKLAMNKSLQEELDRDFKSADASRYIALVKKHVLLQRTPGRFIMLLLAVIIAYVGPSCFSPQAACLQDNGYYRIVLTDKVVHDLQKVGFACVQIPICNMVFDHLIIMCTLNISWLS